MSMSKNKIKMELVETTVFTRWPCTICGGVTEKVPILCESPGGMRVCEECLKTGNLDERLRGNIARHEAHIVQLRDLIGRLVVPSYGDWKAACANYEYACAIYEQQYEQRQELADADFPEDT